MHKKEADGLPCPYEEARELILSDLRKPRVEKRKQEWEAQLKENARIEILTEIEGGSPADKPK